MLRIQKKNRWSYRSSKTNASKRYNFSNRFIPSIKYKHKGDFHKYNQKNIPTHNKSKINGEIYLPCYQNISKRIAPTVTNYLIKKLHITICIFIYWLFISSLNHFTLDSLLKIKWKKLIIWIKPTNSNYQVFFYKNF
jgi:hypothetical protein